jgi:hypothetical protein
MPFRARQGIFITFDTEDAMKEKKELVERRVDVKLVLAAAWASFMFIYVYCDIFSFHRADVISGILAGKIGPFAATQLSLFLFGLLMAIPSLMAIVTVRAKAGLARIVNLVVGPLYFLVNVGNLVGESWAYYWLYGILELGLVAFIFVTALRWPRQAG